MLVAKLDLEALRAAAVLAEDGARVLLADELAPAGPARVLVWLRHFG